MPQKIATVLLIAGVIILLVAMGTTFIAPSRSGCESQLFFQAGFNLSPITGNEWNLKIPFLVSPGAGRGTKNIIVNITLLSLAPRDVYQDGGQGFVHMAAGTARFVCEAVEREVILAAQDPTLARYRMMNAVDPIVKVDDFKLQDLKISTTD